MKKDYFFKKSSGFTLVEMLFFLFIFAVATTAFYKILTTGMQLVLESKYRLGAVALANEKMEIIHNLQYDSIGTTTGIPTGSLLANEEVIAGKRTYHVNTFVQYVDDPLDGLIDSGDTIPNDYKRVKVKVSWDSFTGTQKVVSLISRFVPPGMEVASGDGILSINIIDSAGVGVPQAAVHIVNTSISPQIDINQQTGNNGNLMFPGASESIQKYAITVSKNGYETVATVDPAGMAYSPIDLHASVVMGLLNTKSIVIDLVSNLKIKSINQFGEAIPDVGFHLEGGRILGTDTLVVPAETVYILDSDESTGADGELTFANQSPGQFFLTNIASVSGHTLVGVNPITEFVGGTYKFSILPTGNAKEVELKFANNEENSLWVKVLNNSDNLPLNGASVKLTNASGFSAEVLTSFDGGAFFVNSSLALDPGDYTLEVTADGFQTLTGLPVSVDKLTNVEVKLVAV